MRASLSVLPVLLLLTPLPAPARSSEHAMARMLFVAPNGKPFRGQPGQPYPSAAWFAGADANHDGKLTRDEYKADFVGYFDALDRDHDGEIGPDEITHYESEILPEVHMTGGGFSGYAASQQQSSGDDSGSDTPQPPLRVGGASFFGFFGAPEPLLTMDSNFNRGISRSEFAAAADRTWRALNPQGKPWIMMPDLPKTVAQQ